MKLKNLNYDSIIDIKEFAMTKNGWEFFITNEETDSEDIAFCLVMGVETELGDVYLPEIRPYIITHVKVNNQTIKEIAPPPGWAWEV